MTSAAFPAPSPAQDPARAIAFRQGQVAALAQAQLGREGLFTPAMRAALALRLLSRAWAHYRQDRAIALGERLIGGECAAERDAFLALVAHALPPGERWLAKAVETVRRIAIAPLADEARQSAAQLADSTPTLDAVLDTLGDAPLPADPPADPTDRLTALIARHRYSLGEDGDPLRATAATPCWAVNLLSLTRPDALALAPLPCPGIATRRLFRADLDRASRHALAAQTQAAALDALAGDLAALARAARRCAAAFPARRATSRLDQAWLLLVALGGMTPAQLARALPATKAGAAKLLRQLETARFVRCAGPFAPFVAVPR